MAALFGVRLQIRRRSDRLRRSLVSSSESVTVAPNFTVVPDSLETSDHFGAAELVLQFDDAPFDEGLALLGRVIFRILRQVAVGARFPRSSW